ncbi:MAG TPA: hypothetical protein VG820_08220 [Fimbriimonadaceae bacterium]|nr:hypothetical protein [Fimbriimonadaceae bacterium]
MLRALESSIAASATANWCHADPLLDWLALYGAAKGFVPDDLRPDYDASTDMSLFQGDKQGRFEAGVLRKLGESFEVVRIGGLDMVIDFDLVDATFEAMRRGVEIIHRPHLLDSARGAFAIPTLLVRSDVVNRLTAQPSVSMEESLLPAARLDRPHHYRVVDVKFTTLDLLASGYVGNDASDRRRKVQLLIANRALGQMQGLEPLAAYVLGRSWKQGKERGNSCLDRLGLVAVADPLLIEMADAALAWVRRVTDEGADWEVLPEPSVAELYPNMSNDRDRPWHEAKREIAEALGELTLLWHVTPANRPFAHRAGVYRLDDPNCHSDLFQLKGAHGSKLQAVIETNHGGDLVRPGRLQADQETWREPGPLEFYVDFETVTDLDDDFSKLPSRGGQPLIFMIGCGHVENGRWTFKAFTCDRLDEVSEAGIIDAWHTHMAEVRARLWPGSDPLLFHWSHAETSTLNTAYNSARTRHGRDWPDLNWYDFLGKVVRAEPVAVKGSFAFGLKSIARAMHTHGLIETEWTNGPGDGLEAMLGAWRCEAKADLQNCSMRELPLMQSIEAYNEVDCRVMQEIVAWLRANR